MNWQTNRTIAYAAFLFAATGAAAFADAPANDAQAPDAALARLKEGNQRFVAEAVSQGKPNAVRRVATAHSQHPFAIVIGCADSRTSPELIFDQNIGDLFVVRTAGNLVDDHGLGSIEYAVAHLGTRLIVVLGHQRCGAVKAAIESETAPGHVGSLVRDIQPAVKEARTQQGDLLANATRDNARLMAEKIVSDGNFGEHKSEVRVVSGCYNLDTGVVEWAAAPAGK